MLCSKLLVSSSHNCAIMAFVQQDPVGVTLGGTFGHALCTALAVLGGKMISERISVRTGNYNEYVY